MCVLQDFEAITPNLLARTIETVEGGGLVVLLLKTMTSLKQLYAMTMVCLYLSHYHTPNALNSLHVGCSRPLSNISTRFRRCPVQRTIHPISGIMCGLPGSG